jgi:hypothetical protein
MLRVLLLTASSKLQMTSPNTPKPNYSILLARKHLYSLGFPLWLERREPRTLKEIPEGFLLNFTQRKATGI